MKVNSQITVSQRAASVHYLLQGLNGQAVSLRGAGRSVKATTPNQQTQLSRARGGYVQQKVSTAIPCEFIHVSATKVFPEVPSRQL